MGRLSEAHEVAELGRKMLREKFPELMLLDQVLVLFRFNNEEIKDRGREVMARPHKIGGLGAPEYLYQIGYQGIADSYFLIEVSWLWWQGLDAFCREALLFRVLSRLAVEHEWSEAGTLTKVKLSINPPEIETSAAEIAQYGLWDHKLKQLGKVVAPKLGQLALEMDEAPAEEAQPEAEPALA